MVQLSYNCPIEWSKSKEPNFSLTFFNTLNCNLNPLFLHPNASILPSCHTKGCDSLSQGRYDETFAGEDAILQTLYAWYYTIEMMRTFCHHVLTNQMTLYICSDTCTQKQQRWPRTHNTNKIRFDRKKQNDNKTVNVANF